MSSIKMFLYSLIFNKVKIKGNNNIIDIKDTCIKKRTKIYIYGNNNKILIEDGAWLHNFVVHFGFPDCPVNNCTLKIGKGSSFNSVDFQFGEDGSCISVGEDCMFSFNIEVTCTDTHSILDENNNVINKGKEIKIGSHVWVCKDVKIGKNTTIDDNSIVAQGSIVTRKFTKTNCVIAGNPAKIVKENVNWSRKRPQEYHSV